MPSAALPAFPSRYRDATVTCPCRHHRKSIKHCPALSAVPGHRKSPLTISSPPPSQELFPPKAGTSVPQLLCHGHPGMRAQRMKRLAKASPSPRKYPTAILRCPCPHRQERGPAIPTGAKFFRGWRGYGGGRGSFYKKRPFLSRQKLHSSLPKLPAAHAPARRPQWRAARRPCPPQPCGRRCGRRPGAPPG